MGRLTSLVVEDFFLALVLAGLLVFSPEGPLAMALAAAIPVSIAFSLSTLHFPSRVEIDGSGVAFFAHGRAHRFLWKDIERIQVRRFVVRDRVLVRIMPTRPLRGRYWLLDSIDGYAALVQTLEARGQQPAEVR